MKNLINNIPLVNSFYVVLTSPVESKHTVSLKRKMDSSKFHYSHKRSASSMSYFVNNHRVKTVKLLRVS